MKTNKKYYTPELEAIKYEVEDCLDESQQTPTTPEIPKETQDIGGLF